MCVWYPAGCLCRIIPQTSHGYSGAFVDLSLSTCLSGASSPRSKNAAIHLSGHVTDRQTGKAIEAARIKVLPSTDKAIWGTDSKGEFSFWLAKQEIITSKSKHRAIAQCLWRMTGALGDVQLMRESSDGPTPAYVSGTNALRSCRFRKRSHPQL